MTGARRKAWAAAFARQALSDLEAREALTRARPQLPYCHALHYLQMAAEKVCKAYLHATGVQAGYTHAVVRKHLPTIVRLISPARDRSKHRIARLHELAYRIELLAPALDAGGANPDNAEYPWPDHNGNPLLPIDYAFSSLRDEKDIAFVLKILRKTVMEYAQAANQNS